MFDADARAAQRPRLIERLPVGALLVALALTLTLLALACIEVISGVRAYVGGESQWSKGQKAAVLALVRYADTRDEADWQRYEAAIAVPLGDRRAREALERPTVDDAVVRAGFVAGANHPDDVARMQRLFRLFRDVPFMARAIGIWTEADALIAELQAEAQALRAAVRAGADDATLQSAESRLLAIDARLTPLETRFSATLGEAARQTQWWLTLGMVGSAGALAAAALALRRQGARHAAAQAQALRDSEARRERALTGSSDGFFEWDLLRRAAYFSPRFEQLLGLPPGALAAGDIARPQSLLHADDRERAAAALRAHLRDSAPYDVELRMRHADGGWRWLRSRARSDRGESGAELRLSGSISDITERVAAEEGLRRRELQFRSLWETTGDAVLIVDSEHRIGFANPAAHTLFGHPQGTLAGQPLARLQPPSQRARHVAATAHYLRSGERGLDWDGSEIVGLHRDGHEIPLEIRFSEIVLDGERQFVGFLRDIRQRKAAEQALRDANERLEQRVTDRTRELTDANQRLRELDRLKSEFLATMSHELRTPLNAVLGFTSILLTGQPGPLTDEQRRQLGFVHGSGRHLLQLINDLLDLSRIESGRIELSSAEFDLVALVDEVCDQLQPTADAKGLAQRRELPPALAVSGDRRRVVQVVLNLVANALKFTDAGHVRIALGHDRDEWRLQVEDTGIGISADDLPQLFQPFRQVDGSLARRHEGTGLGLYLSRRLAELMGGRITVASTPGAGSCFTLALPLAQDAAPPPAADGARV